MARFRTLDEERREEFRGKLTAFRNLYAFLSQIIPYQDSELEKFYTFVRGLLTKLPPPGDGRAFKLDDEVALKYYRLQQIGDGSIDLGKGGAYPLKGPTDVGTGGTNDEVVPLSSSSRSSTSFSAPILPRPISCSSTRSVRRQPQAKRWPKRRTPTTWRTFPRGSGRCSMASSSTAWTATRKSSSAS